MGFDTDKGSPQELYSTTNRSSCARGTVEKVITDVTSETKRVPLLNSSLIKQAYFWGASTNSGVCGFHQIGQIRRVAFQHAQIHGKKVENVEKSRINTRAEGGNAQAKSYKLL